MFKVFSKTTVLFTVESYYFHAIKFMNREEILTLKSN